MLDSYLQLFANLNVARNRNIWPATCLYKAPYKPFLLLSILDHIESGKILRNFISPSFELTETFLQYIELLAGNDRRVSMSYPFYHLESSGFWTMIPQSGQIHRKGRTIKSMVQLRRMYFGAKFTDDLFPLIQMSSSRNKLRSVLISSHFAPEFQPAVKEQSFLNCASEQYFEELLQLKEPAPQHINNLTTDTDPGAIRNNGFRKAIVQLYDHRCALCGIKMLTPEGHTIVDAAHIIPWSESHNDHPTNGMALCKTCHWSFDKGLMSVDDDYRVLISKAVQKNNNLPGHVMTLSDRPIFRPSASRFWPDLKNFQWHRVERFQHLK